MPDNESPSLQGSATEVPPDRSRLGEILVRDGSVTPSQLEYALAQQATLSLPIGKILVKLNYVTDEVMRQALSRQLGVPYVDLERVTIDRGLARIINRSYARRHSVIPIARIGRTLTVAMDDPTAGPVVEELNRLTSFSITVVTSSNRAIQKAFRRLYEEAPDTTATETLGADLITPVDVMDAVSTPTPVDEQTSRKADELFRHILHSAIENGTSDIHLEMLPAGLHVRFRIDGVLRQPQFGTLQDAFDHTAREIMSRIKILSRLDIAERRRPQDGSFQVATERAGNKVTVDLRVSVVPSYTGESVVIRLLDRTRAPRSIEELDLSPVVTQRLGDALKRTTGIFLVTGPTGSGKSTTMYACLMRLHKPEIRILTAEDPVEYVYDELSQSEVNKDIGNTFAAYLRAFLRHDPEVIMVGEIRDEETAEMSFRAAQTGHLLLSTLHTNSAIAALPRLLDLKIESSLIASSLIGVLSQRLVRKICKACRQEYLPPQDLLDEFFQVVPDDLKFFRGAGCSECGFTGYKGRMIIADLWIPDDEDMMLITRGVPFDDVRKSAQRTTFSMGQDAYERLKAGRTTLEDLLRVLPYTAIAELRNRFAE
jgi:type IV pilus assembly protein PilB